MSFIIISKNLYEHGTQMLCQEVEPEKKDPLTITKEKQSCIISPLLFFITTLL